MTAPVVGLVGQLLELDVGPVAHGGHCVARAEGRVVFVRHALPGERVLARVTEGGERARYLRADAVEVLRAAPGRVEPPCPYARPGLCGGCDWQHADLSLQRELKAAVVREQMHRLAGLDVDVVVEPVPGDDEGLGWRSRVRFAADASGRLGLHRHRSHDVVRIDRCRIAAPGIDELELTARPWPGADSVQAVVAASGDRAVIVAPGDSRSARRPPSLPTPAPVLSSDPEGNLRSHAGSRTWVREQAGGRDWRVSAGGFWQVHPGLADALLDAVTTGLQPQPGDSVLDLYAGAGLFAGVLADLVGLDGTVVAVESDRRAVADARRNLHALPQVRIVCDRVERALGDGLPRADLVVLDPPRTGAGRKVVQALLTHAPRRIAYVACDPAALARDVALLGAGGYRLAQLRVFDGFPMTGHMECVAVLSPGDAAPPA